MPKTEDPIKGADPQNKESETDIKLRQLVKAHIDETGWPEEAAEALVCARMELIEANRQIINLTLQSRNAERRAANAERQARTDRLTGLANRLAYEHKIDAEIEQFKRSKKPISIIMLDIDYFKTVNDEHGHAVGDDVLKAVSSILNRNILKRGDMVARYGGEEFVIILPDTNETGAGIVAERIRRSIEKNTKNQQYPNVTISLGCATLDKDHEQMEDPEQLQLAADTALYHSKNKGRNQTTTYENGMKMPLQLEKMLEEGRRLEMELKELQDELLKENRIMSLAFEANDEEIIQFQRIKIITLEEKINAIKKAMAQAELRISNTSLKAIG